MVKLGGHSGLRFADMSSELFTTKEEWPRRLLNVNSGSFESLQRMGEHTYGGISKPSYNILSYTWGRWETSKGNALPIKGTTWRIPKIDQKGFSVPSFAKVLQHVKQDENHVWLDVGCIDQEDGRIKASEIGKQAAIFRRARKAYIWLSHSKRNILEPYIMEALCRDATEPEKGPFRAWLSHVYKGVQKLFSDPWFSSLWTLQEGYLRRDAILLFDDASWLDVPKFKSYSAHGGPCTLLDIVKGYAQVSTNLRGVLRYDPERLGSDGRRQAQEICQRLDDVGVPCLAQAHAIALYGVSSRRNPNREHDRIYGIMQVFGLVLGQSAQPDKSFTLNELEDQFGDAVNKANPVLAQSFVHLRDPRPNRHWCLQRDMRVFSNSPVVGRELDWPTPWCQIMFDRSEDRARFQGHRVPFEKLVASGLKFQTVYFDIIAENKKRIPDRYMEPDYRLDLHMDEVLDLIQTYFGLETSILMIGGLEDAQIRRWLGVIVYPSSRKTPSGKRSWARVGVCTWLMEADYMCSVLRNTFQEDQILLE